MSDTQNTDAAKFTTYSTRHGKYIEAVGVDFAREQERRIAELEKRLELWGMSANGDRVRLPDHLDGIAARDETIRLLDARASRLKKICAAAYQLAGVVGAPVRFLDALALHDDVDIDSLLPVTLEECDEFQRLRSRLNKAEVERAWALRGKTFVTPDLQS